MARIFCIPGAFLLFAAFVLNFIVSISLPYLPLLDITRTHFDELVREDGQNDMTQLRFGIWAPCFYNREEDRTCPKNSYAYSVSVADIGRSNEVTIGSSWTRGLAVHPVATAVSLLAVALALSEHITVALVATLTAWLASLLTLIAFLIDIALYAWTKHEFKKLDTGTRTITAPGFWLTFIAMLLLFFGGLSTCCGRIKDRRAQHHAAEAAAAKVADAEHEATEKPAATKPKFSWDKFKFSKKSQA